MSPDKKKDTGKFEPITDDDQSARLLLYALEILGDPGAAEALLGQASGRALRWSAPGQSEETHRRLLDSVTALSPGPLSRPSPPPLPADLRPDPEHFDEDIEHALAGLPGRERAALYLVLVEKLDYEDCAAVLGTTPVNAGGLIYRARRALRERLVGERTEGDRPGSALLPSTGQRLSKVLRSDCTAAGPFISAELDDELTEKQRPLLAAHLEGCGLCSEESARLEQASAAVRTHWQGVIEHLLARGWSRRAQRAAARGRSSGDARARARRIQLGAAGACLLVLVAAAAAWTSLRRGATRAITSVAGRHSLSGGTVHADGDQTVKVELFDGSRIEMLPGAVIETGRSPGAGRPRLRLLAGAARFDVGPGAGDLAVSTAVGRVVADGGSFLARLSARNNRGRRLDMQFRDLDSLAQGERLALTVDSASNRLAVIGISGAEMPVPPGSLALLAAGERPRPAAVPGEWVPLPRAGDDPVRRSGGALGVDRDEGQLVLFGGRAGDKELNDLWTYDPTVGAWTRLAASQRAVDWLAKWQDRPAAERPPDRPAPQASGALLADPAEAVLWLYAGRLGKLDLAETWRLDPADWSWRRVPAGPKVPKSAAPTGRTGASLAACPALGGVVLFGGEAGGRKQSDTWLFHTEKALWSRLDVGKKHPEARSAGVMAADASGRRLFLFGGLDARRAALADTWVLEVDDAAKARWRHVKTNRSPTARSGADMACHRATGELVLFGGKPRLGSPLGDTWIFTPDATDGPQWNRLVPPRSPPAEQFSAPAMVWHAGSRTIILWAREGLWSLRLKPREEPL